MKRMLWHYAYHLCPQNCCVGDHVYLTHWYDGYTFWNVRGIAIAVVANVNPYLQVYNKAAVLVLWDRDYADLEMIDHDKILALLRTNGFEERLTNDLLELCR